MSKSEGTFQEIANDAKEVTITFRDNPGDSTRKLSYFLKKHKIKIVLVLAFLAFLAGDWVFDVKVPEWIYILNASAIIGSFIAYPYAKWLAKYFIDDNRVPIVEIDAREKGNDIAVYYVPEDRVNQIEYIDGSPNKIQTSKGEAIEVQHFEVIDDKGEKELYAKGTWEGSSSGLELKRKKSEIESMYENLEPLARKGLAYDVKWPHIVNDLSSKIVNSIIYEFSDVTQYKGQELYSHVQEIVDGYEPNEISDETDDEDIEKEAEKINRMGNGHKETKTQKQEVN